MNYRHAFHAGNHADVLKHAVLVLILQALKQKTKPFRVLDTHAGPGLYDLAAEAPQRTGEYRDGIARLLGSAAAAGPAAAYLEAVRRAGTVRGGTVTAYPGSPAIVRALLRDDDRLTAVELHPDDARALRSLFADDRRVDVHRRDGYEAMSALLPPKERRGLVLIDPPYERDDEVDTLTRAMARAWRKWPTGTYVIWFPVKGRGEAERIPGALTNLGIGPLLNAELSVRDPDPAGRLNGSGVSIVRPPWRLRDRLETLLPALHQALSLGGGGTRVSGAD